MRGVIYLDAAASTRVAPEALVATVEALRDTANPAAAHAAGHLVAARVQAAREAIASLMRVGQSAVTFVSSATEANNLALRGLPRVAKRGESITTAAEHPSVLATVADMTLREEAAHIDFLADVLAEDDGDDACLACRI